VWWCEYCGRRNKPERDGCEHCGASAPRPKLVEEDVYFYAGGEASRPMPSIWVPWNVPRTKEEAETDIRGGLGLFNLRFPWRPK